MSTPLQEAYSEAVMLNNIGVALLERQCYPEAISTFNGAITTMLKVSSQLKLHRNPNATSNNPFDEIYVKIDNNEMLKQAINFLQNLKPSLLPQSGHTPSLSLNILTYEGKRGTDSTIGVREFLTANPEVLIEHSSTCAIHIKKETSSPTTNAVNFIDVEAAILLHNLGTTYLHKAVNTTSSQLKNEGIETGFRMFQLSYSVLLNNLIIFEDRGSIERVELLSLSIIILLYLLRLASVLGRRNDFEMYELFMMEANQAIVEVESETKQLSELAAAAA